jgi:5-methylcytosine-specific restriction endonuclease McrA
VELEDAKRISGFNPKRGRPKVEPQSKTAIKRVKQYLKLVADGVDENRARFKVGWKPLSNWRTIRVPPAGPKKVSHNRNLHEVLGQFWDQFRGAVDASTRIRLLCKWAERDERSVNDPRAISEKREWFDEAVRSLPEFQNILRRPCAVCRERADVRHHVIQLQLGGTNSLHNVVPLCHACHHQVHPWMKQRHGAA